MTSSVSTSTAEPITTVKTYLSPIDRDGLMAFAEKGRNNPAQRGTNKVHTIADGQFRTESFVGDHSPVIVDEPPHLFGQNTAPAPGEVALSGLGGCLVVGITAVATHRRVNLSKLEIFLEGDIGNPAAWAPAVLSWNRKTWASRRSASRCWSKVMQPVKSWMTSSSMPISSRR